MRKRIFSQKDGLSREHRSFRKMHSRVKEGRVKYCQWNNDADGFREFIAHVGRIPEDMKRPTIGRFDHNEGYRPGNCAWQELSENVAETWTRGDEKTATRKALLAKLLRENNPAQAAWDRGAYKNRKRRGPASEETRRRMSIAQTGRKQTEENKRKASERMKGRMVSQETRDKIRSRLTGTRQSEETAAKKKISIRRFWEKQKALGLTMKSKSSLFNGALSFGC